MTTTPLPDLLAQVPSLNDPAQPFHYEVDGDTIVGTWDIVKAQTLYPTEFATINKSFSVTVDFDEKKGTWKSKDHSHDSETSVGLGGIGFQSSSFTGKKVEKSFSFELGGINKTKDGISPVLAWSFDTDKIKKPLFDFLEKNGWQKHHGLFG